MYTKKLIYTNLLKDIDGCAFSVKYFITEETCSICESQLPYGIQMEKECQASSSEVYAATACFNSKDTALSLLKKLSEYSVTPISGYDCIESIMSDCDFKY